MVCAGILVDSNVIDAGLGWYGRHDEPLSATPRRGFLEAIKLRSLGTCAFDVLLIRLIG